jgi:hypothetical protein
MIAFFSPRKSLISPENINPLKKSSSLIGASTEAITSITSKFSPVALNNSLALSGGISFSIMPFDPNFINRDVQTPTIRIDIIQVIIASLKSCIQDGFIKPKFSKDVLYFPIVNDAVIIIVDNPKKIIVVKSFTPIIV